MLQQPCDVLVPVAATYEAARVASGHVLHDHGTGGNDRAVADPDPGHHRRPIPEPHVVPEDGVAAAGQPGDEIAVLGPRPAHDFDGPNLLHPAPCPAGRDSDSAPVGSPA